MKIGKREGGHNFFHLMIAETELINSCIVGGGGKKYIHIALGTVKERGGGVLGDLE